MPDKLTWDEIKRRYPDEYVVLLDHNWSEFGLPDAAIVLAHSSDRGDLIAAQGAARQAAIAWTGERGPGPTGPRPKSVPGRGFSKSVLQDTHPKAHQIQIQGYRQMAASQKFELMNDQWKTNRELALTGIRSRHPNATDDEIKWQLALLFLERELAEKAYPRPSRAVSGQS